jgi:GTP-binding protein
VDAPDPQAVLDQLRGELAAYSEELAGRPFWIGLSKTDLLPPDAALPDVSAPGALGVLAFSAATRRGLDELLEALWESSRAAAAKARAEGDEDEW